MQMNELTARVFNSAMVSKEGRDSAARFYLTMSAISAALIFLGFAPSFYLKPVIHAPPPLTLLTITHGVVFTAWTLLFVTQSALIAYQKPAPHRQLGILGVLLFGAMVTLGYSTAITAGKLGHAPPGAPASLAFMALPLIGITGTLILVGLAVWNRRRSDWHKRLMLASLFTMTAPATHRLTIPLGFAEWGTWIALIAAEALLVAAMAYDYRASKRIHPAFWVGACVVAATHVGVAWAYSSPAWLALATAITRG
jgi:hypothetical protein